MGVKLWMRNFAQQNLNRFPPANGGYAGVRPTFKSCAPTKPCPQEKSPQITAVLRRGKPHRRSAAHVPWCTPPLNGIRTKKTACRLQTAEPFGGAE